MGRPDAWARRLQNSDGRGGGAARRCFLQFCSCGLSFLFSFSHFSKGKSYIFPVVFLLKGKKKRKRIDAARATREGGDGTGHGTQDSRGRLHGRGGSGRNSVSLQCRCRITQTGGARMRDPRFTPGRQRVEGHGNKRKTPAGEWFLLRPQRPCLSPTRGWRSVSPPAPAPPAPCPSLHLTGDSIHPGRDWGLPTFQHTAGARVWPVSRMERLRK